METPPSDAPLTPDQALELALRLHQAGRLSEAEQIYRDLIQHNPRHPEALHLLGVLHYLKGRLEEGHQLIRRALEVNPDFAEMHFNLGNGLQMQGRNEEAVESYRRAIELKPDYANAHNNLGLALAELGRAEEAVACYQRALEADPNMPETACNLGNLLRQAKRLEAAEAQYRRALEIDPEFLSAYNSLGNVLRDRDQLEEAEACLRRVVQTQPDHALGHYNLALVLRDRDKTAEAIEHYQKAVALNPGFAQAHNNLANLLKEEGRLDEAIHHYQKTVELDPKNPSAPYLLQVLQGTPPEQAPDDYVRALFEHYSPRFDKHLLENLQYATPRLLRQALQTVAGPDRRFANVLDLGCGTGLGGCEIHAWADHLTGIDLSPAMIEQARRKDVYDVLRVTGLVAFLQRSADTFDLVLAADVLVYFGNLAPLFEALAPRLAAGGLFVFSTEDGPGDGWRVQPSGRFTHSAGYIQALTSRLGFRILQQDRQPIRRNKQGQVLGGIYLVEKL